MNFSVAVLLCSQLEGLFGGPDGKESVCSAEDPGPIPGSGRSPEEGKS